ncbi:unnamed protein product, partial [Mesorhabditis belari]|uniref:SH3 domain-containing protein n=1 Tax=Mesorhabditis belari TaxID=2138241 RepID=A0AAF3EK23_9BILA
MAPFNRILSLADVQKRIHQFEEQLKKLGTESQSQPKATIVRRVVDLVKQLDDYLQKVEAIPLRSLEQQEQKQQALQALQNFKTRAQSLCGGIEIKARPTSSSSTTQVVQQVPPKGELKPPERPKSGVLRRGSVMYNEEESSSTDDERKSEERDQKLAALHETRAMSDEEFDDSEEEDKEEIERSEQDNEITQNSNARIGSPRSPRSPRNDHQKELNVVEGNRFFALADWQAEESDDLSIKKGDLLKVIETRVDGWWKAQNTMGEEGMVPKTFLKHFDPLETPPHEHLQQSVQERRIQEQSNQPQQSLIIPQPFIHQTTTQNIQQIPPMQFSLTPTVSCLGDALSSDHHLTAACHLAPRLSESNLAFHDLYWNFKDDKLRKRYVRVSKLVRLIRVEGMENRQSAQANLLRIALFDLSRRTGRQIVSNVHTICANNEAGNWTFSTKIDSTLDVFHFSDVLIRSNYQQSNIVLVIEASIIEDQSGFPREISLGVAKLPLLSDQGVVRLTNRTYTEMLIRENLFDRTNPGIKTNFRLVFKVMDVPTDLVQYVDSLPDILLFQPPFARLAFFYRRRLAEALIRDKENPVSSELLYDPFLASFPRAFDQPDLLDYCRKTFQHKLKQIVKRSESEQAAEFYSYFMLTVFTLIDTSMMPPFSAWDSRIINARRSLMEKHASSVLEHKGNVQFLLSNPFRPLDIFAYTVDLTGQHAID